MLEIEHSALHNEWWEKENHTKGNDRFGGIAYEAMKIDTLEEETK